MPNYPNTFIGPQLLRATQRVVPPPVLNPGAVLPTPGAVPGVDVPLNYTTPTNPSGPVVMTPDNFAPAVPVNLPQPNPDTSAADSLAATAKPTSKSIQDYVKELTTTPTAAESQQQRVLDEISDLTKQTTGRAQAQIDAEAASGATAARKNLTDINNELITANAAYERLNTRLEGQAIPMGDILGQQAQLRRQQASDIGLITARAQVAQGNYALALETANRAVDAKYETVQDQLRVKQAQLAALQPILNKEEKVQAAAQAKLLKDQEQAVQDKKDQEKIVQNIMVEAAKAGADSQTLAKIQKAGSVVDAITIAGETLGNEYKEKVKQQAFDNNIALQKLLIDKAKLSIDRLKATQDSGLSPLDLMAYAQQYAATGNIPTGLPKGTFGAVAALAGALPKAPGAIVSSATGVAPPSTALSSTQSDGISATYNLITQVLPSLKTSFNKTVTNPGTGLLNIVRLRTGDVTQYNSERTNFLNTLLLAMSGKVVSEKELARYQGLIPSLSTMSKSNGNKLLDQLQTELTDKFNSYLANNQLTVVGYDPNNPQGLDTGKANQFDK